MSDAVDRARLGLAANWQQFTLLVVINAFVGGMVGLERAVLPLLAEHDFLLTSRTAVLSFIVTFGVTKALANLFAGRMSDRIGRKQILVAGWLVGVPVPLLIMLAPSWSWIVAANILLGINQGLRWSAPVIMKIDLWGQHGVGWPWASTNSPVMSRFRWQRSPPATWRRPTRYGRSRSTWVLSSPWRACSCLCCSCATRKGTLRPKPTSYRARGPRPSRRSGRSFRS